MLRSRHHAAQNGHLGRVFLTEDSEVRLHDVEELGDNRADSAEMSGTGAAIESLAESFDIHDGGGSGGIHLLGRGREDNLDTFGFQPGAVGLKVAGILGEILRWDRTAMDSQISIQRRGWPGRGRGAPARCGRHATRPWWEQSRWQIPAALAARLAACISRMSWMILISFPNPVWAWRRPRCGRRRRGRLDAPTAGGLLEHRLETGEVLGRAAQRNGIDEPIVSLDERDVLDGAG